MILSETIPLRGFFGCVLMLTGMIISQSYLFKRKNKILENRQVIK